MRFSALAFLTVASASLAAAGCESPQSGGQIGGEDARCVAVTTTPLGPDEASPFGYSPNELVAAIGGARTVPLAWAKGGSTELTLTVTPAIDGAAFVDYEYEDAGGDGAQPEIGCEDAVEVPASISFHTADGAFDETLSLTLSSRAADRAAFFHELDLDSLTGTYEVTEVDPADYESVSVFVTAEVDATTVTGTVSGQAASPCESGDPDGTCSADMFEVATFPAP